METIAEKTEEGSGLMSGC